MLVEVLEAIWQGGPRLAQLLQQAREQPVHRLFALSLEIAIDICNAKVCVPVVLEPPSQVVDYGCGEDRLSCSGHPWTE